MSDWPEELGEKPEIVIDTSRVWCSFHPLPWKSTWPAGAAVPTVRMLEAMVSDDHVVAVAEGETSQLQAVLDRFSPWCCYLQTAQPEKLLAIYDEAGVRPPYFGPGS